MKERKIGNRFKIDVFDEKITLEVYADDCSGCDDCYFCWKSGGDERCVRTDDERDSETGDCESGFRSDGRNVIFREIKRN